MTETWFRTKQKRMSLLMKGNLENYSQRNSRGNHRAVWGQVQGGLVALGDPGCPWGLVGPALQRRHDSQEFPGYRFVPSDPANREQSWNIFYVWSNISDEQLNWWSSTIPATTIHRQLRARKVLMQFKDVVLRFRRVLLLYKVYDDSTLLVINGTSLNSINGLLALSQR